MRRQIVAILAGLVICCLLLFVGELIEYKIKYSPFFGAIIAHRMGDAELSMKLMHESFFIKLFVLLPTFSLLIAFLTGLIAGRREFLIGALSIIPFVIIFHIIPLILAPSKYILLILGLACLIVYGTQFLGTYLSIFLKKRGKVTSKGRASG